MQIPEQRNHTHNQPQGFDVFLSPSTDLLLSMLPTVMCFRSLTSPSHSPDFLLSFADATAGKWKGIPRQFQTGQVGTHIETGNGKGSGVGEDLDLTFPSAKGMYHKDSRRKSSRHFIYLFLLLSQRNRLGKAAKPPSVCWIDTTKSKTRAQSLPARDSVWPARSDGSRRGSAPA